MLAVGVLTTCRSCGRCIVWLVTDKGRRMPVDPEGVKPGETVYEHGRHVSHFATCPQADQWRKKRPAPSAS